MKLRKLFLSSLLMFFYVIFFGFFDQIYAKTPYCDQDLNAHLKNTDIKEGEDVILEYEVLNGFQLTSVFWGNAQHGTNKINAISGHITHTYSTSGKYEVELLIADGSDPSDNAVAKCRLAETVSVSKRPKECVGDPNKQLEGGEECDDGNNQNGDGCSSDCQFETPNCIDLDFSFSPENGVPGTNVKVDFSLQRNTEWVMIDSLNWGDGGITVQSPVSPQNYTYQNLGSYYPYFILRNKDSSSNKIECYGSWIYIGGTCGNGIKEHLEECDGELGCNKSCKWELPGSSNLSLNLSPSTGYADLLVTAKVGILGDNKNIKMDVINWGDGMENEDIGDKTELTHIYTKEGHYTVTLYGKNVGSTTVEGSIQKSVTVLNSTCGNGIKEHLEECDDENTEDGDGCSSVCKWEKAECSAINLSVDPTEGTIPFTVNASFKALTGFIIKSLDWGNGIIQTEDINTVLSSPFSQIYNSEGDYLIKILIQNKEKSEYLTTCIAKVHAKKKHTSSYSGGGGFSGGRGLKVKDYCPDGDYSPSYYDNTCGDKPLDKNICQVRENERGKYSNELIEAFQWAYSLGITTVCPIKDANLDGPLLRRHMAKMISMFSMEVLNMKPNYNKHCSFPDINDQTQEMKDFIKLSCQLGLMGYKADGKTKRFKFEPNKPVSKAQFGTLLSRLIWPNKNDNNNPINYYVRHFIGLEEAGIKDYEKVSPWKTELRGAIMVMLYRTYNYKLLR